MAVDDDKERIEAIRARLHDACRDFDDAQAEALTAKLINEIRRQPDPIDEGEATTAMTLLRRRRLFELMERLGDALILSGQTAPAVRRLYAQSQLDQGNISSAIRVLEELAEECAPHRPGANPDEHAEAVGLLGRANKQQYVDANHPEIMRNRTRLKSAIAQYESIFDNDDSRLWHGVNAFALRARALHDRIPVGDRDDEKARTVADKIVTALDDLDARQRLTAWDYATGLELHCGLAGMAEDEDEREHHLAAAADYLEKYTKDQNADAFELASTTRQLEEVWLLESDSPDGSRLLPSLEVALLSRNGGAVTGNPRTLNAALGSDGLERVFGAGGFVNAQWVDLCQQRLRNVCRIQSATGRDIATGFLVAGEALCPTLAGRNFVLTNNHVVKENPNGSMFPRQPIAHFEATGVSANVTQVIWQSKVRELDASLLALDPSVEDLPEPIPVLGELPPQDEVDGYRTYIIGHPKGNPLSVSIQDNHMLDMDDRVLHYRTPTEPGSSGSPVFDQDWELIGLHHAGKDRMDRLNGKEGVYEANEGIRIDRVQAAIQADLNGGNENAAAAALMPTRSAQGQRLRTICDLDLRSAELRDETELEPGDILVFRANNNWISKLISSLDGYWSHSAIYVGNGQIAHSYSQGIGVMPLKAVASAYDEGYAAARPARSLEERTAAATRALEIAQPGTEYSGRDLGLAFALLARLKIRSLIEANYRFPEDDGLEALLHRAEVEATCSGFVYTCYATAKDSRPLEIVPAPGLTLEDGWLSVIRDLESADAQDDWTVLEALSAQDDGLEAGRLPNWDVLKSQLGLIAQASVGVLSSIADGGRVRIEAGVTPGDLWCSPEMAEHWFLDAEGRTVARVRSEHCPLPISL